MVKVKDTETSTKNWVIGSTRAYLSGEKNLNWVMGIIKDANLGKEKLKEILEESKVYSPNNQQLEKLQIKCNELGLL